jgi:hypothetical protein
MDAEYGTAGTDIKNLLSTRHVIGNGMRQAIKTAVLIAIIEATVAKAAGTVGNHRSDGLGECHVYP